MIERSLTNNVASLLNEFPAVAILGPRQVGKTTMAREIAQHILPPPLYLDLERPSDLVKLSDPELYFQTHSNQLIIIDEIQRMPKLFQLLRSIIDERRQKGQKVKQFLLLGSASKELLKHSSESLAGRIIYTQLSGFTVQEIRKAGYDNDNLLWLRGSFPDSFLSPSDSVSMNWRQSFIMTYLEREIPQLGYNISAEILRRALTIFAHSQGDLLNATKISAGLGISVTTIIRYIDLFEDLFLVRLLRPWSSNVKKRLVKAPKLYIRDSGVTHALLNIKSYEELLGHYVLGGSFEGFVIENILSIVNNKMSSWFYRTAAGAEVDLILESAANNLIAIEIKRYLTPSMSKGFYNALLDIKPNKAYIIYPGNDRYYLTPQVEVVSLHYLLSLLTEY
ncbi:MULTISPECIES: ATP-binding protein [unclassified Rickettsia]|uniref:ATP-binding protein n=1 Tax=unclassified Rickettsia TaxID=114295 RepID=UPI003132EA10